jgi:predicted DNA-binding transcriptional regulator
MSSFLRALLGTERLGDIPTRHMAVFVYLASTKRKDRHQSLKKLGDFLGISENTVWAALQNLYSRGYIKPATEAPPPDEPPGRDPGLVEVTSEGRRALKPFFNVIGVLGLFAFIAVSLVVGGFIGYAYAISLPYLSGYAAFVVALFILLVVFYAFATYQLWKMSSDFRRDQLLRLFRAAEDRTAE